MSWINQVENKRDEHLAIAESNPKAPNATAHAVLALFYELQVQSARGDA